MRAMSTTGLVGTNLFLHHPIVDSNPTAFSLSLPLPPQPSPLLYSLLSTLGLPVHSLCTAFYLPHLEGESHGLLGNYKVLSHAPSHLIFPSTGPGREERKRDNGLSQVGLSRRRAGNEDLGDLLRTGSQGRPRTGRQGKMGTNSRKPCKVEASAKS